jgi:hypothetical protein
MSSKRLERHEYSGMIGYNGDSKQSLKEGERMSTRHKGVRDRNYADMLKNPVHGSPMKRFKSGDMEGHTHKKQIFSGKSRGSGLGFADSDEERENHTSRPFREGGS